MKRGSRKIPELPMPVPRRKRGLSEEEHALWESVARQVKPLRKKHRVPKPAMAVAEAETKAVPKPVAGPKAAGIAANHRAAKAGAAAAGADRPPRAFASVARPQG